MKLSVCCWVYFDPVTQHNPPKSRTQHHLLMGVNCPAIVRLEHVVCLIHNTTKNSSSAAPLRAIARALKI
eukprot:9755747-Ditylum_brightwellii.AAC.1